MASEPRWIAIRDDLEESLALMSRANGYHYDYAPTTRGVADFHAESDYTVPSPFLEWGGTVQEGGRTDEQATARYRHNEAWMISFSIRSPDLDHEAMAARVRSDVHTALMGLARRTRGEARVNTFDVGTSWSAGDQGGKQVGGILGLSYVTRWDHTTGDMSSQ